jgi:transposase InsO family protein
MIGDEMKHQTLNLTGLRISALALKLGMSRQNFYKGRIARQRAEVDAELVEQLVKGERMLQPRLGGRKLFKILAPVLENEGIKLGRDRFFDILREKGLLVPPLPKSPGTTRFEPSLPVFLNLVAALVLTGPNQAWAADITYIRTDEGFLYLSLITDMWSRKIVGFHVGANLETEGPLTALSMALSSLTYGEKPVHHSDRGCQYASHLYVGKLKEAGLQVSMTEELHCYENAIAERVNGILKQEYHLGFCFRNKNQAKTAVKEAVFLYNTRRPHKSLDYETPEKMHGIAA